MLLCYLDFHRTYVTDIISLKCWRKCCHCPLLQSNFITIACKRWMQWGI